MKRCVFILFGLVISIFVYGTQTIPFYGLEFKFKNIKTDNKFTFADPIRNEKKYRILEENINKDVNENLVIEITNYRNEYKIQDFALLELLKKISSVYSENKNIQKIFLRELIIKFGYDAVLYFDGRELIVYAKFDSFFLSVLYTEAEGGYYCDVSYNIKSTNFGIKRLNDFNKNLQLFKISEFHFKLPEETETIRVSFKYNGVENEITYKINKNLIDYLSSLPNFQINLNYLDTIISTAIRESFSKLLEESKIKDTLETLNFMLTFCQQIKYIDDMKSLKMEKYMFPLQTIYLGYGDCDDKSILFNFLVKSILKIPVYYFLYTDKIHMNSGIDLLTKNKALYTVNVEGKEILLCEPTSKGLKIGNQMEICKGVNPKVYKVD